MREWFTTTVLRTAAVTIAAALLLGVPAAAAPRPALDHGIESGSREMYRGECGCGG